MLSLKLQEALCYAEKTQGIGFTVSSGLIKEQIHMGPNCIEMANLELRSKK